MNKMSEDYALKSYEERCLNSKRYRFYFGADSIIRLGLALMFFIEKETYLAIFILVIAGLSGLCAFFISREIKHYEEIINIYKRRSNAEEAKEAE
ncbi:MAG: hypothetical protein D8B41_06275 [Porphyromonas sp.]|nr:MAG: hypothetical protein D8B41_06275 [Porphyromonas sp.]